MKDSRHPRNRRGPGRSRRLPNHVRRAIRARQWMRENPPTADVIAMLGEYQRDLEQEVARVAGRIAELEASTV